MISNSVLVFLVPSVIYILCKIAGYASFAVYLPFAGRDVSVWRQSLYRCFVGLVFHALLAGAIWILFLIDVLPLTRGHVGLPAEYLLAPLAFAVSHLCAWIATVALFSGGGHRLVAIIVGTMLSVVFDVLAFALWWFVWFTFVSR